MSKDKRNPNGYLIPAEPEVEKRLTCIRLKCYDDPEWYTILWGHLYELSKWWNYQRDESHNGKLVAGKFLEWLNEARNEFENSNLCAPRYTYIDFTVGDGGVIASEYLDLGCGYQITPYDDTGGGVFDCGKGWGAVTCDLFGPIHIRGAGIEDWFDTRQIHRVIFRTTIRLDSIYANIHARIALFDESGFHYIEMFDVYSNESQSYVFEIAGFWQNITGILFEVSASVEGYAFFWPCVRITSEEYWYDPQ